MLPMSGVGEPRAAPGAAGAAAGGAAAFGAAGDPAFAPLPALFCAVVPVVVDDCWASAAITPIAASAASANRYGRRRPRAPVMVRRMRVTRAVPGGVVAVVIVVRSCARARRRSSWVP